MGESADCVLSDGQDTNGGFVSDEQEAHTTQTSACDNTESPGAAGKRTRPKEEEQDENGKKLCSSLDAVTSALIVEESTDSTSINDGNGGIFFSAEDLVETAFGADENGSIGEGVDAATGEEKGLGGEEDPGEKGGKSTSTSKKSGAVWENCGKWTIEEEEYAGAINHYFDQGLLNIPVGTLFRAHLATVLKCDPMRITKKFTAKVKGKKMYKGSLGNVGVDARLQAEHHLKALEHRFLKSKDKHGQRRSEVEDSPASNRLGGAVGRGMDLSAAWASGFASQHGGAALAVSAGRHPYPYHHPSLGYYPSPLAMAAHPPGGGAPPYGSRAYPGGVASSPPYPGPPAPPYPGSAFPPGSGYPPSPYARAAVPPSSGMALGAGLHPGGYLRGRAPPPHPYGYHPPMAMIPPAPVPMPMPAAALSEGHLLPGGQAGGGGGGGGGVGMPYSHYHLQIQHPAQQNPQRPPGGGSEQEGRQGSEPPGPLDGLTGAAPVPAQLDHANGGGHAGLFSGYPHPEANSSQLPMRAAYPAYPHQHHSAQSYMYYPHPSHHHSYYADSAADNAPPPQLHPPQSHMPMFGPLSEGGPQTAQGGSQISETWQEQPQQQQQQQQQAHPEGQLLLESARESLNAYAVPEASL